MPPNADVIRLAARVLEQTDKTPLTISLQKDTESRCGISIFSSKPRQSNPLCGFSIFRNVDGTLKAQLLAAAVKDPVASRAIGSRLRPQLCDYLYRSARVEQSSSTAFTRQR